MKNQNFNDAPLMDLEIQALENKAYTILESDRNEIKAIKRKNDGMVLKIGDIFTSNQAIYPTKITAFCESCVYDSGIGIESDVYIFSVDLLTVNKIIK